jgi:hypothetical protein
MDAEEIAMYDLEESAEQLVQDWKTLRHRLEHVQQEQRLGQFYRMHLDLIEASLAEVPELVYCMVSDVSTPCAANGVPANTWLRMRTQQPPSGSGFAARIRRMRQAVDDIDMHD